MKRVLIITYYWPPSGGAGVQRWLKFSKYLPDFGWEPIILAPDPKKATYPVQDESLANSVNLDLHVIHTDCKEFFNLYKNVSKGSKVPYAGFASEPSTVSFVQKLSRFIRGNFFLPDPRKGWNKHAIKEAKRYIESNKVDCIITTGPPHSTHLIGLNLQKQFNIPWLADFRDPWTDIYYYQDFYPTKLAHHKNLKMEREVLEKADKIITVSPSWKDLFGGKIENGHQKVEVLTNGFDEEDFSNPIKKESEKRYITYVGTMSDIYPIEAFIEALSLIFKDFPNTVFRLIGTVSEVQKELITSLPASNIEIIPYVEHERAISYMFEAAILILLIPRHSSSLGIVPGKIFEYLAVRKPILVIGDENGDSAKIIKSSNSGDTVDPNDSEQIFKLLISKLNSDIQINSNQKFSRKQITRTLSSILDELSI